MVGWILLALAGLEAVGVVGVSTTPPNESHTHTHTHDEDYKYTLHSTHHAIINRPTDRSSRV